MCAWPNFSQPDAERQCSIPNPAGSDDHREGKTALAVPDSATRKPNRQAVSMRLRRAAVSAAAARNNGRANCSAKRPRSPNSEAGLTGRRGRKTPRYQPADAAAAGTAARLLHGHGLRPLGRLLPQWGAGRISIPYLFPFAFQMSLTRPSVPAGLCGPFSREPRRRSPRVDTLGYSGFNPSG